MNKQSRLPLGSVIGILGGGQLGRMLSLSASQLGFKTHIYDPDFNAPAKQVTNLSSTFKYDDIKKKMEATMAQLVKKMGLKSVVKHLVGKGGMSYFIDDPKEAKKLQTNYFYRYNTSLNGLMIHHDIPPEEFLKYVHTIDLSFMKEDMIMRNELEKLDMEKFIFTNGSAEHAKNILTHLGVYDLFGRDKVFDIQDAGYIPKPEAKTFDLMLKKFEINPKETIYIEDIAKNLSIGYERGCITVWLINDEHFGKMDSDKDYISHKIENLSLFLKEIRLLKSK